MVRSNQREARRVGLVLGLVLTLVLAANQANAQDQSPARADPPGPLPSQQQHWNDEYRRARKELELGNTRKAHELFLALEQAAPSDADRRLAREMAAVCFSLLERAYGPRIARLGVDGPPLRSSEEISVLYTTAFLYGLGTGAWFILQARPSSIPTAIAPFAGLTIASVGAVAIADRYRPFEAGVPQSIAAGTYLGLGQAAWVVGYQQARAARVQDATGYDTAWRAPTIATVLWLGATGGAALGTAVGVARKPSPGRVSYTMSMAIWSGAIASFAAGAALPEPRRLEQSLVIGGGAYNAGLLTGLATGPIVSPSLTRVRLVDLGGVAGGLLGAATYLVANRDDQRATFAATAIGATAGLGLTWWLTSGMRGDTTGKSMPNVELALVPTAGGMEVRAGYTM